MTLLMNSHTLGFANGAVCSFMVHGQLARSAPGSQKCRPRRRVRVPGTRKSMSHLGWRGDSRYLPTASNIPSFGEELWASFSSRWSSQWDEFQPPFGAAQKKISASRRSARSRHVISF